MGQIFTPFFSLRADVASVNLTNQPGVSNFIETSDSTLFRGMPVAGLEYRYPFVNVQSWGTKSPSSRSRRSSRVLTRRKSASCRTKTRQSFVFDDGNLFRVSTSSRVGIAWKAVAGRTTACNTPRSSTRAVTSMRCSDSPISCSARTPLPQVTPPIPVLNSGLDTRASDYVARIAYQPDRIFTFTTRYRFGEENFDVNRFELEGKANFDRLSLQALYGNYAAQPELGFLTRREGILGGVSYK